MYSFEAEPLQVHQKHQIKRGNGSSSSQVFAFKKQKKRNFIEIPPEVDIFEKKGRNEYFYVNRPQTPKYQPLLPKVDQDTQIDRLD